MSADDELRRRRKRRALRVPVDEVPRRSAVSGFPPAPESVEALAPSVDEVEELEAFEEITSEVEIATSEPASDDMLSLESEELPLEEDVEPEVAEALGAVAGVETPSSEAPAAVVAEPLHAPSAPPPSAPPPSAPPPSAPPPSAPPPSAASVPPPSAAPPSPEPADPVVGVQETTDSKLVAGAPTPEVTPAPAPSEPPPPSVVVQSSVVVSQMVRVSSMPPPPGEDFESEPLASYLAPDEPEDDAEGLPPLAEERTMVEEAPSEAEERLARAEVPPPAPPTRPSRSEPPSEAALELDDEDDAPELTIEDEDEPDDEASEELELEEHDAEELEPEPVPPAPEAPAAVEVPPRPEPKPRRRPWFETFFNDDYLRTVRPPKPRDIERECDFIAARLNLAAGATILDVGCGLGLHAIELTRRGYLVVGLDLSLPMLSRAGDEAQDLGVKINFLHGDMREMTFDGAFDAVLCWGTTFGYFDDESNKRVVERLHRALKPKGVLLLDVVNRDYVIRSQPNLIWFEGDGCICMEESKFNYFMSRLEVKRTVMLDDGRQRDSVYTLRSYALHELGLLLHQQGFRVAEVSGMMATPGVFFGADSPRILVLAERRVDRRGDADPASRPPPPGSPGSPEG